MIKKAIKYFPLVALGQSVAKEFREAEGEKIPFYLHRRALGSIILLVSGFLAIHFGIQIDESILTQLTDNLQAAITAGMALWGIVLQVIGTIKRQQNVQ